MKQFTRNAKRGKLSRSLDRSLLQLIGLDASDRELSRKLLTDFRSTLELALGTRAVQGLSAPQMRQFEDILETGDEYSATAWLREHIPDFDSLGSQTFEMIEERLTAAVRVRNKELRSTSND